MTNPDMTGIDDEFPYGSCSRHMRVNFRTHVHNSEDWTTEDYAVISFLRDRVTKGLFPGMMQQEAINDFQNRDFDAYAVGSARRLDRKRA